MNIRPLIEAVGSLESAIVATFEVEERKKIEKANKILREVLQARGVFLGKPLTAAEHNAFPKGRW